MGSHEMKHVSWEQFQAQQKGPPPGLFRLIPFSTRVRITGPLPATICRNGHNFRSRTERSKAPCFLSACKGRNSKAHPIDEVRFQIGRLLGLGCKRSQPKCDIIQVPGSSLGHWGLASPVGFEKYPFVLGYLPLWSSKIYPPTRKHPK